MFNLVFCYAAVALLGICVFFFLFQALRALHFRHKIADTHGFTEGIMTGIAYPMQIIFLSLIFLQFISFIIFTPSSEFLYCLRSGMYILTVILFFVARAHTPKLLAYWFGKTALWDGFGEKGKILYSDIYCASISKSCNPDLMNTQRLCKFSFYANTRTKHGLPIKFTCKMTALELKALSRQVDIRPHSEAKSVKKEQLHKSRICGILPYIKAVCVLSVVMLLFSSGIMYPPRYNEAGAFNEPTNTVTQITSVKANEDIVGVYFERLECADFYSANGDFLFSVFFPYTPFAETDLRLTETEIIYRLSEKVYYFDITTGEQTAEKEYSQAWEVFSYPEINSEYSTDGISVFKHSENGECIYLLKRPAYCFIFSFSVCWTAFVVSLTVIFVLKLIISDRTPPKSKPPKPKKNQVSDSVQATEN